VPLVCPGEIIAVNIIQSARAKNKILSHILLQIKEGKSIQELEEIINKAFGDRFITDTEHPIVVELLGL